MLTERIKDDDLITVFQSILVTEVVLNAFFLLRKNRCFVFFVLISKLWNSYIPEIYGRDSQSEGILPWVS